MHYVAFSRMLIMYKVGLGPVTTVVCGYSGEYVMPH